MFTLNESNECTLDGWFVLMSNERTVWSAPDAMLEVAPSEAFELYRCEDEAEARAHLVELLSRTGLTDITDADIRPIEECGACGADFDTRQPHVAVILELCHGTPEEPRSEHVEYRSRCCPRCVSTGHPAYQRLLAEWTSLARD